MLTATAIQVQTYCYKVPFVHSRTNEVEWIDVEVISDRFRDLRDAIALVREPYGLGSGWKVDFDGVVMVDHPAPF